jgi:hypothetical protein
MFHIIIRINGDYLPKHISQLVFAIEKEYVSCEVGTEFLNITYINFRLHRVKKGYNLNITEMFYSLTLLQCYD